MRLLLFTQVIDRNDPVLGFFHRWVEALAPHFEAIEVVCLKKGDYSLPENVQVHSLGKEMGRSQIKYLFNFYRYIFSLRYEKVMVHMNQEYVLLGGLFWMARRKKIFLWRNHPRGSFLTRVAIALSNKVFCTSSYSYTARFKKTEVLPAGIDTDMFTYDTKEREPNSILILGRISPVKRVERILEALKSLKGRKIPFTASVVGGVAPSDQSYGGRVGKYVKEELAGSAALSPAVPNAETPALYSKHAVLVNITPTGSLDKTILEAMACGTLVLTSNPVFKGEIPELFLCEDTPEGITEGLTAIFSLSKEEYDRYGKELREYVIQKHSLSKLVASLSGHLL